MLHLDVIDITEDAFYINGMEILFVSSIAVFGMLTTVLQFSIFVTAMRRKLA